MFIEVARQVIVENIKFEAHSSGLQCYSKKDLDTRRALKTKLSFKSFGKYVR